MAKHKRGDKRNPLTRHHLIPKERKRLKNHSVDQTILHFESVLHMWRDKHDAWHKVFKNLTLDEIINLLSRIKKMKLPKYHRKARVA